MKNKEEILENLRRTLHNFKHLASSRYVEDAINYIESLNPNRIDDERMKEIHYKNGFPNYDNSYTKTNVDEYNSTLPEIKELEPLPKDMPEWVRQMLGQWMKDPNYFSQDFWNQICKHYGTPKREELPSVWDLTDELTKIFLTTPEDEIRVLAKHLIAKYSLPKREWWMMCKKFMFKGKEYEFYGYEVLADGTTTLISQTLIKFDLNHCTPYIEPNTREKLLATMTDEQKELLKQWEAER